MTTRGLVVVVDLPGELELATIERVEYALGEVDDSASVVVDLRRTTFLDSATLARFIGAARRQSAGGGRLVLAEARASTVRRVLSITQMDRVLPYAETVDEAIALLSDGAPAGLDPALTPSMDGSPTGRAVGADSAPPGADRPGHLGPHEPPHHDQ